MTRAVFSFVVLLAGCAPQARDITLADVDLRNMQMVGAIRARLEPEEGIAFANYVVRHHARSANFCGQPLVAGNGKEPITIGEAVDLSILRDAEERQALIEAQKLKRPGQLAKENWDRLISARDIMIDSQSRLRMEHGDKAVGHPEWKLLESKMSEIDQKLVAMKPAVFGPVAN